MTPRPSEFVDILAEVTDAYRSDRWLQLQRKQIGEVDNSFRQDHSALKKIEKECQQDLKEKWLYRKYFLV